MEEKVLRYVVHAYGTRGVISSLLYSSRESCATGAHQLLEATCINCEKCKDMYIARAFASSVIFRVSTTAGSTRKP